MDNHSNLCEPTLPDVLRENRVLEKEELIQKYEKELIDLFSQLEENITKLHAQLNDMTTNLIENLRDIFGRSREDIQLDLNNAFNKLQCYNDTLAKAVKVHHLLLQFTEQSRNIFTANMEDGAGAYHDLQLHPEENNDIVYDDRNYTSNDDMSEA
jgi:hypothetical protein